MKEMEMKELFCRPSDERALISFCMRDLSFYFSVCSKLAPNDFLYPQHELLILLFQSLAAKGSEKFDTELISSEAVANGIMDNIGGVKYIQTISNIKASEKNFDIHLGAVVEAATKYKLYNVLYNNVKALENNSKEGLSSGDLIGSVENSVMDLATAGMNINEPIDLGKGLIDFIEEHRLTRKELSGISTGYPILDKQIDGMIPGTLMVVAARLKMGKSTLLTNIAINVAYTQKIPVLYVDTELTFEEWRTRALSCLSGVFERDVKHGGYTDEAYARLKKTERIISSGKLLHEYMPGYSVDKLVALYKKYKHKDKIGLIVFDYLKEPDSSSVDKQRKEYQLLGDVTTKLKDLAGQLNIPALTAVQLNRDEDIADSDRIARYADIIGHWGTRTKEEYEAGGNACGNHKLVIKNTRRGGATSKEGIGFMFFKEKLQIREVPVDRQYFHQFDKVYNADSGSNNTDGDDYYNEELS